RRPAGDRRPGRLAAGTLPPLLRRPHLPRRRRRLHRAESGARRLDLHYLGDEIHPGETVEEKISLSERFGLWVTFYPFDQDEYLQIVATWLKSFGIAASDKANEEALQWSLQKGSRSGRVAYQFARDWAGRHAKRK